MSAPIEQWGSRYGFILATIGGAVGIGNIWRFSYVAGENGGAVFLFIYLAFVFFIGVPLMIAELAIGRHAKGDAISAFEISGKTSRWRGVGWLGILAAVLLLSYYAVIAGWALKYFAGAVTGDLWRAAGAGYGGYFEEFISHSGEPLIWQAVVLMMASLIVVGGVRQGIERLNRILIPVLAVIIIVLAGFSLSLPNSDVGVSFLLTPDWSVLTKPEVYAAALGQAFFTLGIGMVFFITYGSYMPRTFSVPTSAIIIAVGDTAFAIIAGLAIFPAVFAFGGNPAAGPELAFVTLPQVFLEMPAGPVVGSVFFLLLAAAAITSMVALLEIPVAALIHRTHYTRRQAAIGMTFCVFLLGVPSALSYGVLSDIRFGTHGILDAIDYSVSNFLLPVTGILTALYVGWRFDRAKLLQETDLGDSRLGVFWLWLVRILVPAAILGILIKSAETL
ncbi:MAG: NSS family neurotransmitter:Na+ symporter [Akkermansiaceae bacterium]|jgi:NSS family neurotransmitter:Na+ symporter